MKRLIQLLCTSLLIFEIQGCSSSKTLVSYYDSITLLKNEVDKILDDTLFVQVSANIKIISLEDNSILYERSANSLVHPASNIKLITTAAALTELDTNYQFITELYVEDYNPNKKTAKNIIIKGYGDPDFSFADLDTFVQAIINTGIIIITGNIIVDDTYFDDTRWGRGWMWDDESDPDTPCISALSINKNCINITLITDATTSYLYSDPITDFVTLINNTKKTTGTSNKPIKIKNLFLNNHNTIVAEGEFIPYKRYRQKISLRNPSLYVGTLFKESLQKKGIAVLGEVISAPTNPKAMKLYQISRHIKDVVVSMNKISDNLAAENIVKILGAKKFGPPGTFENGLYVIRNYLSQLNIDTTKLSIADGSGVSRYNLISPNQITQFLTAVYSQPKIFPVLLESLPIGGIDGTLSNRMTNNLNCKNVKGKTGTLNDVSCLSGYIKTLDDETLAFSIMMQHFVYPVDAYRKAQDKICSLLTKFSRKSKN